MKIGDVLNRMHNWKQASAYRQARECKKFPKSALVILNELSKKYGDCGWQFGSTFDEIDIKNNEVAKLLGYDWDDDLEYWKKAGVKPK